VAQSVGPVTVTSSLERHWSRRHGGTRTGENEANLVRFLNSRRVDVVFADEDTSHHHARLFHQLRRQGTPIPTNDLWIAALVVKLSCNTSSISSRATRTSTTVPQIPRL
jgi:predicted nucleic acid-binding protein